jgi:hypothetical protein
MRKANLPANRRGDPNARKKKKKKKENPMGCGCLMTTGHTICFPGSAVLLGRWPVFASPPLATWPSMNLSRNPRVLGFHARPLHIVHQCQP